MYKKIDLSIYGIENPQEVYYNLSYDELFEHETNEELEGFEKGFVTNTGAVAVDTGIFTGRSPKDKYIVKEDLSRDHIWWAKPGRIGSDNHPIDEKIWRDLYDISRQQLSGKKLYVTDAYCGANENSRIKIRVISEVAWVSHFVKNMFIRPDESELKNFTPDFVMLHACKAVNYKWEEHGLNSDVYVAFNLKERMSVIGGTWYGGEIKKGFFSIMNYYLPLKGIASMHCSANMGKNGDTAIFFGLSGTGKTTLSADPNRYLIGDDEHGWDDEGVFNLEGGCYAKCIGLDKEKEPDIYAAIKRDALLENVVYNKETGEIDFTNPLKTENTRVSYPIYHIKNIVKPISRGGHPKKIIFLTADAFGVLPPVAKLTKDQTMYYFLSGYTSKLAGTERGIKEPIPTFSSAFGAAFLLLHPIVYAKELTKKMEKYGATCYLVNTGWIGGPYGVGKRIDINTTRRIISAILNGELDNADYEELPTFGLFIPKEIEGIDSDILNPKNLWKYESAYVKQAQMLAEKFIENFANFSDTQEGKRLVAAGPKNKHMKQFYDYYESKIKEMEEEHRLEIKRLKEQIYILQNAFNDYISFNTTNTNYKQRKLNRHVPMFSFFETDDHSKIKKIHSAILDMMDIAGFSFYHKNQEPGAFNERMAYTIKEVDMEEVHNMLNKIHECFNGSQNHPELKQKVDKVFTASENIPQFALKIGHVLIVKTVDEENIPRLQTLKMTISSLIHFDKNPNLLKNPKRLLVELNTFNGV
ncbi:MAG: hypothetical protein Kow0068_17510 [Marinilabiliales bacterium]